MQDLSVTINSANDLNPTHLDPTGRFYMKNGVLRSTGYGFSLRPFVELGTLLPVQAASNYKHTPADFVQFQPPGTLPVMAFVDLDGGDVKQLLIEDDRFYRFNSQIRSLDLGILAQAYNSNPYWLANSAGMQAGYLLTIIEDPDEHAVIRTEREFHKYLRPWYVAGMIGGLPDIAPVVLYNNAALPAVPGIINPINFLGANDDQASVAGGGNLSAGPIFVFEQYRHLRVSLSAAAAQDVWLYTCAPSLAGSSSSYEAWAVTEVISAALWTLDPTTARYYLVIDRDVDYTNEWLLITATDALNTVTVRSASITYVP